MVWNYLLNSRNINSMSHITLQSVSIFFTNLKSNNIPDVWNWDTMKCLIQLPKVWDHWGHISGRKRKSSCWLIEAERRIYASVSEPSLVQIKACRRVSTKPLSGPMLEYWIRTLRTNFCKIFSKTFIHLYSRKCISKYHLRNSGIVIVIVTIPITRLLMPWLPRPWTAISLYWQWMTGKSLTSLTLRWRHNGPGGVSNHQPYDCLLNRLFRGRLKKTSKLRVIGHLCGEFTGPRWIPSTNGK